jgi:hypothetical protein
VSEPPKTIEAYPLYWPEGRPRSKWQYQSNFKASLGEARDGLLAELSRLGARKIILSTNIPLRQDGLPYANASEPHDSGAAVYFEYKGKPMCFACDKYKRVRENLRAIEKTIDAIRGIERWGSSDMMERAFRGFTALPEKAGEYWRDVLQIPAEQKVNAADIETAFRRLAHVAHPDKGGDVEQWHLLNNARANALRDIGAQR